jgi:REP element-mobilizing transposase RayT
MSSQRWENFSIWRGRLPHWRADNVSYYVTFRHRRDLDEFERNKLLYNLKKPDGKAWDLVIACVLPDKTELIFRVTEGNELSDIVERAKKRTGKDIIKKSGEKWSPFYDESYDHIIREDTEFEEFWTKILESPVELELVDEPGDYPYLYVAGAP